MVQELEKRTIYFSLGLTLDNIPESGTLHKYDGGTRQKEYTDFETSAGVLTVVTDEVPCYGCTRCGIKVLDDRVAISLLVKSARIFSRHGDRANARHLINEARDLKRISP